LKRKLKIGWAFKTEELLDEKPWLLADVADTF